MRIQYFDLAKGFCILLVVWFHLQEQYGIVTYVDSYVTAIRMPLYFFLSGFFFKTYKGMSSFIVKKTRKLLIPFAFFYLTTSVMLPILAHRILGMTFATGHDWRLLYAFLTYDSYPNIPLWFLLALFQLNVAFYLVHKFVKSEFLLVAVCLLISILLGATWDLPASLSKAMNGMIYFGVGYLCHRHEVVEKMNLRLVLPIVTFLFVVVGLFSPTQQLMSVIYRYVFSVLGITSLVCICRIVNYVPYISYVGRYSIMLLVTHEPLIRVLSMLHIGNIGISFALLALSYLVIIPFMRRFMPHVTAQ